MGRVSQPSRSRLPSLNRLNAVNPAASAAIGAALEELAIENELRVGIITDVGRSFCAGADLKEIAGGAMRLAEKIATNVPLVVEASKRVIHQGYDYGSDWNHKVWGTSVRECMPALRTADAKEGPRAFAEKRRPHWTGA
jgi:enoyl-CoA hydratase/carnithine racemase